LSNSKIRGRLRPDQAPHVVPRVGTDPEARADVLARVPEILRRHMQD
jgi:hypothetical protein